MLQEQQKTQDTGEVAGKGVALIVHAAAFTIEAWLHRGFGVRYVGAKGPLGFLYVCAFFLIYRHDDPRPLAVFLGFYTAFWILAQLWAWYRRMRGRIGGHSRYSGIPHAIRIAPFLGEVAIKWLEPLVVMAAGYGVHHVNRPLGTCLCVSGVALLLTATFRIAAERERVLDMNDAVAGQQITAGNLRVIRN